MNKNWIKNFFLVFNISAFIGFLIYYLNGLYPLVGRDYCYFLPRVVDTYLHYRVNGFSIQWHTPSFGGGVPAYPNPQHIQFSLPQFLTFLVDPWSANLISLVVFLVVGYFAFYKLGRDVLNFGWKSSSLGALFFIANGFIIEKAAVGHVGYQVFPLISLILYLIFAVQIPVLVSGIFIALSLAIIIHEAGFYVIVILALTSGIAIPLIFLLREEPYDLKRLLRAGGTGIILGLIMSSGKIYAIYTFMRYFPREYSVHIYNSFFEALIGVITQFFLIYVLGFVEPTRVGAGTSIHLSISQNGPLLALWEWDISISIFLILLLVIGAASLLAIIRQRKIQKLTRSRLGYLVISCFFVGLAFQFASARGLIYELVRNLPGLNALQNNPRFSVAFVLPLAILGVYIYERKLNANETKALSWKYVVFSLGTLGFLGIYLLLPLDWQHRPCDYTGILDTYRLAKSGETFPVSSIRDVDDDLVIKKHTSSFAPYEPIFGYSLEDFKPAIKKGSVYEATGGYFNMTNPSSLIYDPDSTVLPFERFKVEERGMMEDFLARKQPDWPISTTQKVLDKVSMGTFILCILLLLAYNIKWVTKFIKS